MKKSILILLTIFYVVLASGVSVNLHYCGGKFKSVSFFVVADETDCCGDKEKNSGCCNDKTEFVKIENDQNRIATVTISDNHPVSCHFKSTIESIRFINAIVFNKTSSNYHSPPLIYEDPLFLRNRVLLI